MPMATKERLEKSGRHATNLEWPKDEYRAARKMAFYSEMSLSAYIRRAVRFMVADDQAGLSADVEGAK